MGNVAIDDDSPISIQSILNVPAADVDGNVRRARELGVAGYEVLRVAIPDRQSVRLTPAIKTATTILLVTSVHFDYQLTLESVEAGIDEIRVSSDNTGSDDRVKAMADIYHSYGVSIRTGVSSGSLEKEILTKRGGSTARAFCESTLHHAPLLRRYDPNDIVLSIESSRVGTVIEAYRLTSQTRDYPLHSGVTETGAERMGLIKSAIGIGSLLQHGIGDTIRVSLTADPVQEIVMAMDILRALNLHNGMQMVPCPTCGRTNIDPVAITDKIEHHLDSCGKPITVAMMGCAVNESGEACKVDIGIVGGNGVDLIFKGGGIVRYVPEDRPVGNLIEGIESL